MNDDPTRRRVLEAAGPLFAARGFDAVGVREIADRASASPAAVNYHFRSKEDLYVETVRHAAAACEAGSPMPAWPEGTPPQERLRGFVRAMLGRIRGEGWHRELIFREVADPRPGACEEFVRGFVRPSFQMLQALVAELSPPGTPGRVLRLLSGSVMGQILHYQHARHVIRLLLGPDEHASLDLDTLATHIARFSLAGLKGYQGEQP